MSEETKVILKHNNKQRIGSGCYYIEHSFSGDFDRSKTLDWVGSYFENVHILCKQNARAPNTALILVYERLGKHLKTPHPSLLLNKLAKEAPIGTTKIAVSAVSLAHAHKLWAKLVTGHGHWHFPVRVGTGKSGFTVREQSGVTVSAPPESIWKSRSKHCALRKGTNDSGACDCPSCEDDEHGFCRELYHKNIAGERPACQFMDECLCSCCAHDDCAKCDGCLSRNPRVCFYGWKAEQDTRHKTEIIDAKVSKKRTREEEVVE